MRIVDTESSTRMSRWIYGIAVALELSLIVSVLAGLAEPPLILTVFVSITLPIAVGELWQTRPRPENDVLIAAHSELEARCAAVTARSDPYMAFDRQSSHAIYVSSWRRLLWLRGYMVEVCDFDDADSHGDPASMRNRHDVLATCFSLTSGRATVYKSIDIGLAEGTTVKFMDVPNRRLRWKEVRALQTAPAGVICATPEDLHQVCVLLDTAAQG